MGLGFLTDGLKAPRRQVLAATLLISGTLAWFFLLNISFSNLFGAIFQNDPQFTYYYVGRLLFYGVGISCIVVGSFVANKINRTNLLLAWIILGILATVSLALFQGTPFLVLSGLLLGVSLGFGLPSSMAFIAECTAVEERARVSGTIIMTSFLLALTTYVVALALDLSIMGYVILFALVRTVSLFALLIDRCDGKNQAQPTAKPHLPSTAYRDFVYYLIPWLMFCAAAGLASNLMPAIPPTAEYEFATNVGNVLRYVLIALFGIGSGLLADRFGRKQPIYIGLVTLGVSFALLGIATSATTVLIYLAASGVAWGCLFTVFLTVPGDLSVKGSREKFYGLGYALPIGSLFALSTIPYNSPFPLYFAQILSMMLFVAVIPVLRAKETLPPRRLEERKMQDHLKKVEDLIEKEQ